VKAIVNTGPSRLEMLELPLPEPGTGQVRIRSAACAVCATDLAMIAGWARTPFGSIPGHEWSGTVDAVGEGVDKRLVGRKCVAENVLAAGGEVGFEHPGGYAECFLTDAANVHTLPNDVDLTTAALIEPLAVCVRGIQRLGQAAEPAIVFGDGPIGLLTAALLEGRGSRDITLIGGREYRLSLASELGATRTVNYHRAGNDLSAAIRSACGINAFVSLIEASGSAAAMEACIELAAPDARLLVLGDYGDKRADFPWNALLHKELHLIGSNASAGGWIEAVALATSGRVPLRRFVSHVVPAERFDEAIRLTRDGRDKAIKVVMTYGSQQP